MFLRNKASPASNGRSTPTRPISGFQVPKTCDSAPLSVLDPSSSWPSKDEYTARYRQLAYRFVENFKKFESETPEEVRLAGPRV